MTTVASFRGFILALFFLCVILLPSAAHTWGFGVAEQGSPPQKEITVWAITASKVYQCPESRWYGKSGPGREISECQALREGYHPAFGRGCGSVCAAKP